MRKSHVCLSLFPTPDLRPNAVWSFSKKSRRPDAWCPPLAFTQTRGEKKNTQRISYAREKPGFPALQNEESEGSMSLSRTSSQTNTPHARASIKYNLLSTSLFYPPSHPTSLEAKIVALVTYAVCFHLYQKKIQSQSTMFFFLRRFQGQKRKETHTRSPYDCLSVSYIYTLYLISLQVVVLFPSFFSQPEYHVVIQKK
jgi:hypothetical protein